MVIVIKGLRNGLIYKNWSVRHIYYNMVGYTVNGLGFVSLYDLHSSLLQYPLILRSEKLDSLTFLKDDRIDFVLAQPYTFSPKIRVSYPSVNIHVLAKIESLRKLFRVRRC